MNDDIDRYIMFIGLMVILMIVANLADKANDLEEQLKQITSEQVCTIDG